MIKGLLLAESLRLDAPISVPGLRLSSIRRADVSASVTGGQPPIWTFVEFEGPDEAADPLAQALSASLEPEGGWYADFGVGDEHVVVFARRVFRYPNGDQDGRAAAAEYGRSVGVPEPQLDWSE